MIFNWFHNIRYMQYVYSAIATLTLTSVSMFASWPSPTLPVLQNINSPFDVPITDLEGSWIVSSITIATPISCLFVTWQINKLGRKGALILSSFVLLLPWIIIIFAKNSLTICLARLFGGFGFGCAFTATAMYSGEIADTDIRGKLGVIAAIMKQLGTFIVLAIGPFISYYALIFVCLAVPALSLILSICIPESPYHLVINKKYEEARQVIVRLAKAGSSDEFIDAQLTAIKDTVEKDMESEDSLWTLLRKTEYRKVLLISLGVKSLNQFSGVVAIDSYMQQIIGDSASSISPEHSSVIFGFVQLLTTILAIFLVDKLGRKPLLITSAIGSAIALAGEASYFYLHSHSFRHMTVLSWLPTCGIVFFLIMSSIGITTIPMVIVSEIFPTNIKSRAIAVNTMYGSLMSFLITKFFKPTCNLIGMHITFAIFTTFCLLGALFVVYCMPETKGKTFDEIQTELSNNKSQDSKAQLSDTIC